MAITPITVVNHNLTDRELVAAVDNFMAELPGFSEELNAAALAMNNNSTNSTSTSALTIATGALSLTVQTAKSYVVGMSVKVALTSDGTQWMFGDVTAYNSGTGALSVYVASIQGAGSGSAWTVSQSSPGGASVNGSATQDFSVRTLKQQLGIDIASAATVNLNAASGDTVDVTGATTITAITLTAGNVKTVRHTGAQTLTNSASLILPGGDNIITQDGDYSVWIGYPSGVVRCLSFLRAGGSDDIGVIKAFAGNTVPSGCIACPPAVSLSLDPAIYPALFAKIGYSWSGGASSGNFSPPWVPIGFALMLATPGTYSVGAVIGHFHTYGGIKSNADGSASGATPEIAGGSFSTTTTGGAANYAAAMGVKFIVRYK